MLAPVSVSVPVPALIKVPVPPAVSEAKVTLLPPTSIVPLLLPIRSRDEISKNGEGSQRMPPPFKVIRPVPELLLSANRM